MKIVPNKKFPYKIGERLWRSYYTSDSKVMRICGHQGLRLTEYTPCNTHCKHDHRCPYGKTRFSLSNRRWSWWSHICVRAASVHSDEAVKQAAVNGYIVGPNGQRYNVEFTAMPQWVYDLQRRGVL